jgi:NAD(P)-dependent dehydrogenase (short-subunit alcohol dehydrogenase family)
MIARNGQVALVTGASLGIGAGTALALARAGFDLVVSATRLENLEASVARIVSEGARVTPIVLDLRSAASIDRALEQAICAYGQLDVLFNNAGVVLRKNALDVTRDEWHRVIDTNLSGTFFLSRGVAKYLIAHKRPGAIINMASTHALVGFPTRSVYGIAKAAIVQMTRMLAIEWAQYGVRVNALAPGRVDSQSPSRAENAADPDYMRSAMARVPLHRSASIDEVAAAVCYLASPQAAYITGQTLVMDGGLTAQ